MDLLYRNGNGKSTQVVYEGAKANSLMYILRLEYGARIDTHDSNLKLLDQPDFSNIPKNLLDCRNKVGMGMFPKEAQDLARSCTLSPLQQEFMSCHPWLYHLPHCILFRLAQIGFLPKQLLKCQNKPALCIVCQFGQAHCCPWQTKGKKSGYIRTPARVKSGDGVSVNHIVSVHSLD